MHLLAATLAWLLQTTADARDAFAWLGSAADILAVLSAVVALVAWSRARKAATEAQEAVRGLLAQQRRLDAYSAAVDLSSILQDLMAAQNARQWRSALERYARVRPLLVRIRSGDSTLLSTVQQLDLAAAAAQFTYISNAIVDALQAGNEALANLDVARYNAFVADIADTIEEIKIALRERA